MTAVVPVRQRAYHRVLGPDWLLPSLMHHEARVLDVGSSDGSGSAVLVDRSVDAVDIHRPSLVAAQSAGRRGLCVQADVLSMPFRDGAYDLVTALDVIEHFTKDEGLRLLDELERVCHGFVVVQTPRGFVPQAGRPGQPWMEHKSGWMPVDLEERGYEVNGTGALGVLRHHRYPASFRLGALGKLAGILATPIARRVPQLAFDILAVKQVA